MDSLPRQIMKLFDRLEEYYTPENALRWMNEPHPQLGGTKPWDHIHAKMSDGIDDLNRILDRLDSGAYL